MIIKNQVKCNHCGDIIESKHRHDFKTCSCGAVSVDGGRDYLRRCYKAEGDFKELSIVREEREENNENKEREESKESEDKQ